MRLPLFNPLDQFLTAKRILLRQRSSQPISETSITAHILSLQQTSLYNYYRSKFPEAPPLFLYTRDVFRLFYGFSHRISQEFDPQLLVLAQGMAGKTSENEFLQKFLIANLGGCLDINTELQALESMNFNVGFEYFEDYVDSAIQKLYQIKNKEITREIEKYQDFFVMLCQVSDIQVKENPIDIACFIAAEIYLMKEGGIREHVYKLSKRYDTLVRLRQYLVFDQNNAEQLLPMNGGGLDISIYEIFLKNLFE
ncbi:hypothetical protein SS50377_28181 [Spironucleus salmonicida]|uniref:Uncharacterized protein n=1 Tax=Spironucleus salmonicida TaxID=348837 RepID=V6LP44_9EUKA|nr:hypothetical protein SS50377_28181 [Spironucleus salmonicida]|eukprot:EST46375.1 Hypothetical protein SS50377_13618 [Spironucleus salmonicida]